MNKILRPISDIGLFQFLPSCHITHDLSETTNYEEFLVVWLDANIDTSDDCLDTQRHLRAIINYLNTFNDVDKCIEFISSMEERTVFFVVASSLRQEVLPRIINLTQIIYIYIFGWIPLIETSKNDKIRGLFVDKNSFYAKLTDDVRLFMKCTTPSSIFCSTGITEMSISKEKERFESFQILMETIVNIDYSDSQAKTEMIEQCRLYYLGNIAEQRKIDEFASTYTAKDAIHWYTRDSFVYRLLNKALRTQHIEIIYKFRFFISDLYRELRQLHWRQLDTAYSSLNKTKKPSVVYRGQYLPTVEIDRLKSSIGQKMTINSFISVTHSLDVARAYSGNGQQIPFFESVIFNINMTNTKSPMNYATKIDPTVPFCDIFEISQYADENELLFNIGTVFCIDSIEQPVNGTWFVNLNLDHVVDYYMSRPGQKPDRILYGFFQLGRLEEEELSFDQLTSAQRDLIGGLIILGATRRSQRDHRDELVCYQKALEVIEISLNVDHPLLYIGYRAIKRILMPIIQDWKILPVHIFQEIQAYSERSRSTGDYICCTAESCMGEKGRYYKTAEENYREWRSKYGLTPSYRRLYISPFTNVELGRYYELRNQNIKALNLYLAVLDEMLSRESDFWWFEKQFPTENDEECKETIEIRTQFVDDSDLFYETKVVHVRSTHTISKIMKIIRESHDKQINYPGYLQIIYNGQLLPEFIQVTLAELKISTGTFLIWTPLHIFNYRRLMDGRWRSLAELKNNPFYDLYTQSPDFGFSDQNAGGRFDIYRTLNVRPLQSIKAGRRSARYDTYISIIVKGGRRISYSHLVQLDPDCTLQAMRQIFAEEIGVSVEEQIIWYDEKQLLDETITVRDYGISNGSTIVVAYNGMCGPYRRQVNYFQRLSDCEYFTFEQLRYATQYLMRTASNCLSTDQHTVSLELNQFACCWQTSNEYIWPEAQQKLQDIKEWNITLFHFVEKLIGVKSPGSMFFLRKSVNNQVMLDVSL